MTEAEKQAIERINNFKSIKVLYGKIYAMHTEQLEQLQKDIETAIKLIEKKDKIIDEMAEWINRIDSTIFCNKSKCNDNCKECVIKEFTKKVEVKDE